MTRGGVTPRTAYAAVFLCFFVSGFCSLLYQVLWTRLAFAQYGIVTPVLSTVVAVFMLGLGVGAAYGERGARWARRRFGIEPLACYAAAECVIALGGATVPALLWYGGNVLLRAGSASSTGFMLGAGACIALALFPWCVAMGATLPLMMAYARRIDAVGSGGFSFLYAANVLGAAAGAALTALVLIEVLGLRGAALLGVAANLAIAAIALVLARATAAANAAREEKLPAAAAPQPIPAWAGIALFCTGFASLGLEVCWARDFTFELLTTIYSFGAILATYLLATYAGSLIYRARRARGRPANVEAALAWLFPLALLPVVLTDPRSAPFIATPLLAIVPFCALLGFATPAIVDRFSGGDAARAGRLYAVNVAGGILGPLAAGYLLLPLAGIRWSTIALAAVCAVAALAAARDASRVWRTAALPSLALAAVAIFVTRAYDDASIYPLPREVRRDYAAAVVAFGSGPGARLTVNAIPITVKTTDTKVMAHLPLVLLRRTPRSALDICFGMGTTFRSLAAWHVDATAVDLSPSVLASFGFFYPDAPAILADPRNVTVADDGRRYLTRTARSYDVITLDPPPPAEASGSSLLYSTEFYALVKRRLAPGGILAQWLPHTETAIGRSVALALARSFPYVRVFEGRFGTHFIASTAPLGVPDARAFVERMPPAARRDLVELEGGKAADAVASGILASEKPLAAFLPAPNSAIPALSDDRPYNEYFVLRRLGLRAST